MADTPDEAKPRFVKRWWIEESDFSDLNLGMVEWSDGVEEFVTDVLKDPALLNRAEYDWMVRELAENMPGLQSISQIYYVYLGIVGLVLESDVVELEARSS